MTPTSADTTYDMYADFARDGFVVARDLLDRDRVLAVRAYAETLLSASNAGKSGRVQTAFDRSGGVRVVKASGLADRDARFRELATDTRLVDAVETLLGAGSRRFRDVLVVKPARTGGVLSYHQDSAYWDVEPQALVSCWIPLGDVSQEASCLTVIPGTHTALVPHALYVGGRQVPQPVTRALRRLVTYAGTGDNPDSGGGNPAVWKAKRWLLADTTKYAPLLFDLQDFRLPVDAQAPRTEVALPVKAGDVILFHSLLWHASGPNRSDVARMAEIVSFMGPSARFVGRGHAHFPLARA